MAEKEDSVYLPSLELCLNGQKILLSWSDAYHAVCDTIVNHKARAFASPIALPSVTEDFNLSSADSSPLVSFLDDPFTRRTLGRPFDPFAPPSADGKAQFDKLTSAINLAPNSGNGAYDIKEIKADSSWLSNEAKIDQISALRIVILEYQSRPRVHLLSNLADHELDGSIESLPSSSIFDKLTLFKDSQLASGNANGESQSEEARRTRLLHLFLVERLHVLRTCDALIRHYVESMHLSTDEKSCLVNTGASLCSQICHSNLSTGGVESCLFEFVGALKQRMNRLESGSGWLATVGGSENLELQWQQNQIDELIPILQLSICVALRLSPSSKSAVAYFTLLSERSFFHFEGVSFIINIGRITTNLHVECGLCVKSNFSQISG
jgi:nuclear pore complex protein Nup188